MGPSPVQLLLGRRTRTRLPTDNKLLDTPTSAIANDALTSAKARQAEYYNRGAKDRPPFAKGQTVRMKFDDQSDWRKAEVANVLPHRSYELRLEDGTVRRRTSRHVRFSTEPPIILDDSFSTPSPDTAASAAGHTAPPPSDPGGDAKNATHRSTAGLHTAPVVTRSGRVIRRPARYSD